MFSNEIFFLIEIFFHLAGVSGAVGHQAGVAATALPVGEEPVGSGPHSLSLFLVDLQCSVLVETSFPSLCHKEPAKGKKCP